MEDKTKKYKGIKFLNVGQQFVGVEKTKKYSSNALSINHNFPMFNKVDTLRSSGKNSAKSSLYEIRSINTKKSQEKSNKKSENNDIEVLKKLIEIKKEEERLSKENPNINIKLKTDKLIRKSLSSKNLKDLKNKIISFKSIIINNINTILKKNFIKCFNYLFTNNKNIFLIYFRMFFFEYALFLYN